MSKLGHLSDERSQALLKDQERTLDDQEKADLISLLETYEGRRFYYRLVFELGGLHGASWFPAIKDGAAAAQHHAYAEGRRSVARTLELEAQAHCLELWLQLLKERFQRSAAEEGQQKRAKQGAK